MAALRIRNKSTSVGAARLLRYKSMGSRQSPSFYGAKNLPVLVRERGEWFAALMFSLQCQFPKGVLLSIVSGAAYLAIQGGFGKAEPADGLFPVVVKGILLHYCISTPQTDTYACLNPNPPIVMIS